MEKLEVDCCDTVMTHECTIQKVKENMPAEDTLKELAEFYKVFGDATRIRILCVLLEAEVCVCDLAELLDMTQSAISHQLRVLRQARLVTYRKDGKTAYYSLNDDHVECLVRMGMEHVAHQ